MRLRHVAAIVAFIMGASIVIEMGDRIREQTHAVEAQAAALNRLAAAQEADTELTRRYWHALEDAEEER